jgi:hypothetical protein
VLYVKSESVLSRGDCVATGAGEPP